MHIFLVLFLCGVCSRKFSKTSKCTRSLVFLILIVILKLHSKLSNIMHNYFPMSQTSNMQLTVFIQVGFFPSQCVKVIGDSPAPSPPQKLTSGMKILIV